jgi:hypothetical protein
MRVGFRVTGAFTVEMPEIATAEADLDLADPSRSAAILANELQQAFETQSKSLASLSDFERLLGDASSTYQQMTTTRIVCLIAQGRTREAEQLTRERLSLGEGGGFGFLSDGITPGADFNKIVLRYLTDRCGPS